MAIDSIKCIYRIFLASPGDLVPERRFAEEVVIDVNTYMASRQWYVELHKWENLSPGFGRAQALINRHIERCDLFVGLLWERWGQPTGQYTSGFHEEYEVALSRRQRSGKPEIWMAFKTPRRGKLDDP